MTFVSVPQTFSAALPSLTISHASPFGALLEEAERKKERKRYIYIYIYDILDTT